jgi:hypothetical protein
MDRSPERLLDAALPRWDVTERHARMVLAPPVSVRQAIRYVSMPDLIVTCALIGPRLAGKGSKGAPDRKVLDALPPGELARREPHELLLALVAPTSLRVDLQSVAALRAVSVDDLTRPLPDGWVRIGMDFRLTPVRGTTGLETEARICATGPTAKRRFAAYRLVIRPGSGLIRRELLRAVARRAEAIGG